MLPPPEGIRVRPLKGEANLRVTWDQQCEAFVNSIKISRCEGLDCSGFKEIVALSGGNSFLDPNDLEFGKIYTYQLETEFTVGKSEKVTESGGPGDIEPWAKA